MKRMSHARTVGRNLLAFAQRRLPAEASDRAKTAILDTIGVTLAGSAHDGCRKLRAVVTPTAKEGRATILGTDLRLNVLDAALMNGTAAHMLDFDDSNSHMFGHVSVAVLPSLLATAEKLGSSGRELIHAFICGYETGARFGGAASRFQYTHGWHPTTTVGIFAAVGANAVLLKLDEEQIAMAIGLAAHMASGIKSNFGSMTKPFGVGHAARNALLAVLLAREGFTSGETSLEHHHGYLNVFDAGPDNYDAAPLVEEWTAEARILDRKKGIKQKRFACCYACAPPLDAALEIAAAERLRSEDIEAIEIGVHPIRYPHINVPDPATPLAAKFSVHYCVARALAIGRVVIDDFEPGPAFTDPTTRRLMQRTTLTRYARDNPSGAEVTIRTRQGQSFSTYVEAALGSTYDHWLSEEMVEAKFLDCAGRVLPPPVCTDLHAQLVALDGCADIRALTRLMATPQPASQVAAE